MKTRNQIILALFLVLAAAGAVAVNAMGGGSQEGAEEEMEGHDHAAMLAGNEEAQPVRLDAEASRRIGVTYARVTRGPLVRTVRTVGFVTYDETRLSTVNPKIDGWAERLFVDFTGAPVRAGQPLLEVYSPELVTAQEELILARALLRETEEGGGVRSRENAEELLNAARRRLEYWDIPLEEIKAIEERGTVTKTLTLWAPFGGIVLEKNVVKGARIMAGMDLFRLADLSWVWVEAEIFEKDISLIQEGQHGMVSLEAYPGEFFHGTVTYIYPTVSPQTRTGKIRLELRNPDLRIKPGMYARVELTIPDPRESLLVPRSAVLLTGERSLVFFRGADGRLYPREVTVGLTNRDQMEILTGLEEGDVVAASAIFLIDAESNLGSAMRAMGEEDQAGTEEMDQSEHDMGGMQPDTSMTGMDHSEHDMGGMPAGSNPDTTANPTPPGVGSPPREERG